MRNFRQNTQSQKSLRSPLSYPTTLCASKLYVKICAKDNKLLCFFISKTALKRKYCRVICYHSIYQNSKFLVSIVCFAELVWIGLWPALAQQHSTYTRFLPRPARKKLNVPKLRTYCPKIYCAEISFQWLETL